MKKAYTRFLWHLKEINKTFSNQPSYYSAKRIMEFLLFTNAVVLFDWYVIKHFDKLTFAEMCEAFILNMAYAGFMRATLQKEKRNELKEEPKEPEV
jgi:hypothetical protein